MFWIPVVAALLAAGTLIISTTDRELLLAGLGLHSAATAILVLPSSGWGMSGALFVGNATAIIIIWLAYQVSESETSTPIDGSVPRFRLSLNHRSLRRQVWRKGPATFPQIPAALLAGAIAYGLSDKPVLGLPDAALGLDSFVAYWALAIGLMIFLMNSDIMKVGIGLIMMINAGQVMYLVAAKNLESMLMAATVVTVIVLALAVSHLAGLHLALVTPDRETTEEHDQVGQVAGSIAED